jgi:hypothetical protein
MFEFHAFRLQSLQAGGAWSSPVQANQTIGYLFLAPQRLCLCVVSEIEETYRQIAKTQRREEEAINPSKSNLIKPSQTTWRFGRWTQF